jgi:hypothetical protein
MPLNISQGGGDYLPWVKYNAKAGRWYVKKDDKEVEVQNPEFVADFANIKTGWFYFAEGKAPSIHIDPTLGEASPKPSEDHKRGFKIALFSPKHFGGVVELTGASMHLNNAIVDLYAEYEAEVGKNAGKLPVVKCEGTEASKDKFGTNYKPVLKISKWVDRPKDFDDTSTEEEIPFDAPADADMASEF